VLTEKGREVSTLYLVERGEASVVVDETIVSKCHAGDFAGAIGFLARVPAYATVNAASDLKCLAFNCESLASLCMPTRSSNAGSPSH
jgi:CRP-like cAMP-binding protein